MKKEFNLKALYLYASSFTALLFFLFGTVSSINHLVALWQGEPYYQTYAQFRTVYKADSASPMIQDDTPELQQAYQEEVQRYEFGMKKNNIRNLAGSVTACFLGLFFWLFFWAQTKKKS